MIFSDPKNTKRFRVIIESIEITKKGRLRMKANDHEHPEEEPGYMTFNERELANIKKVLLENESDQKPRKIKLTKKARS